MLALGNGLGVQVRVDLKTPPVIVRALYNYASKSDNVQLHRFDTPAQAELFVNGELGNNPKFLGAVTRQRGILLDIVV